MIPYCKDAGIGLVPWSPLARGVLARPWTTRDSNRETTDLAMKLLIRTRESEADKAIVDRVENIAKAKGVSMAQIAIAWLQHHGTFPALGLNTPERIDEAVGALQVKLTEEEVKELEEPYLPKGLSLIEI
jgi:versiconal hemiacetal acetate reductase